MALYGVSITKQLFWQGKQEQYDNTYYYEGPAEAPAPDGLKALVDAIVFEEKQIHGTGVTFLKGRVWSAGGTKVQNVTLGLFDLSGAGQQVGVRLFGEAAAVVEWECARPNVLGRKVYLRKFLRTCNNVGSNGADQATGQQAMTAAAKALFVTYGNNVQTVEAPVGVNYQLRSEGGRLPKANDNAVCNDFLRSREFRRN